MEDIFQALKPLVWPKFREEGPPEFIQDILSGRDLTGQGFGQNPAAKSILELWTIGYRPVTTLAILSVLSSSPRTTFHGAQIGHELERRFGVKEGWFTHTRYYTDRIGKMLTALTRLEVLKETEKKDSKSGRVLNAYQITPDLAGSVSDTLRRLSEGQHVSLFLVNSSQRLSPVRTGDRRECLECGFVSDSLTAVYCERCGHTLKAKCEKCNATVDVFYEYCTGCGNRKTNLN